MTVQSYAAKYGIPPRTVYKWLYRGHIPGTRTGAGWDITDVPPPTPPLGKSGSLRLSDIDDYTLTLIWLNGTVCDDAVLIRNKIPFYPEIIANRLDRSTYTDKLGRTVCKLSSLDLIADLRSIGFTGRKDETLPPPSVDPILFVTAFIESRTSFSMALHHDRHHPGERAYCYYSPCISFCASYPILTKAITILSTRGYIPERKLSPAANVTSATVKITSSAQMHDIYNALSPIGQYRSFWDKYLKHIVRDRIPYYDYKSITTPGTPGEKEGNT